MNWKTEAARLIYDSYPDSDLLAVEPPQNNEEIDAFRKRARDIGDSLFEFIVSEASGEEVDAETFLNRMYSARRDVEAVISAVEEEIGPPTDDGAE